VIVLATDGFWIVVCAMAVAVHLAAERSGRAALKLPSKLIASVCFVVVGALGFARPDTYGAWVIASLLLCAFGDLALVHSRGLPPGLALFLLGHVGYLLAFQSRLGAAAWPKGLVVPLALVSAFVMRRLWPHLGNLRWAVAAYVTVITLMVWGAVSIVRTGHGGLGIAAGAVLFYLSDLAVARNRFVRKAFINRALGLPVYYAGQILLALSVGR